MAQGVNAFSRFLTTEPEEITFFSDMTFSPDITSTDPKYPPILSIPNSISSHQRYHSNASPVFDGCIPPQSIDVNVQCADTSERNTDGSMTSCLSSPPSSVESSGRTKRTSVSGCGSKSFDFDVDVDVGSFASYSETIQNSFDEDDQEEKEFDFFSRTR
jgi:hypothetical protein